MKTHFDIIHALPAYGRDYKSKAAVLADWHAGKDFRDSLTGQYLNIHNVKPYRLEVWIRYQKGWKICKAD
jgi:hypothetical protein